MSKINKIKNNVIKNERQKKIESQEEELKTLIKKLGVETKKVPENLSNVNEEFSFFLKIKK